MDKVGEGDVGGCKTNTQTNNETRKQKEKTKRKKKNMCVIL